MSEAASYFNHALSMLAAGNAVAAAEALRRATQLKPDYADAHFNLALLNEYLNQPDQAIAGYRQAIASQPDHADALNNLGAILLQRGASAQALELLQRAIRARPGLAEAHNNLGKLLFELAEFEKSAAACRRAIEINPALAEAHDNLGNALLRLGDIGQALQSYRRAVAINPNYAIAQSNLGAMMFARAQIDQAIQYFRRAMALNPTDAALHSNLIYTMEFHPRLSPAEIARERAEWSRRHADPLAPLIKPPANSRDTDRTVRIGYISPDFRDHSQSFFTLPLLAHHDREQFQIFCYDDVRNPDAVTGRFKSLVPQWRRIHGKTDDEVAATVRADGIDILIDLNLHMERNRLLVFAQKPAPVQVTWLGYPGSTGLKTIDYRLSDPYLDPPDGDESGYSEQTIRLPESFWCYDPQGDDIEVQPPPVLRGEPLTFGCLNNFAKVNGDVLELWAEVLRAVPQSNVLILCEQGPHQYAREILQQLGVEPQRIQFHGRCPRRPYLELYHRIDIGLDTFPANGHTTTMDSLWMGVPVVTLPGPTAISRGGASVLSNIGLPELIAKSPQDYVRIMRELAVDLPRLSELRATLRQRLCASPVMDAPRFARNMEAAYRAMWRRWCGQ